MSTMENVVKAGHDCEKVKTAVQRLNLCGNDSIDEPKLETKIDPKALAPFLPELVKLALIERWRHLDEYFIRLISPTPSTSED